MEQLPDQVRDRMMHTALLAGARVITQAAKAAVPVKTGAIRKNIIAKVAKRKEGFDNRVILGVLHGKVRTFGKRSDYDRRGDDPFYFRFQELGYRATGRHRQTRPERASGRRQSTGRRFRKIPGKKFLTKSASSQAGAAFEAVRRSLLEQLDTLDLG